MRFGFRELIFVSLMVGLLVSTYVFVFKKANSRREQKLAEIDQMDKALTNLRRATAGIDDMGRKINEAVSRMLERLPRGISGAPSGLAIRREPGRREQGGEAAVAAGGKAAGMSVVWFTKTVNSCPGFRTASRPLTNSATGVRNTAVPIAAPALFRPWTAVAALRSGTRTWFDTLM